MIIAVRHQNHNDGEEEVGDTTVAKSVAAATLFFASFLLGTSSILLKKRYKWNAQTKNNTIVKLLLGMGGGVLLCTTFLHIFPEVNESFEELNLEPDLLYAELLMCCGFFMMYFVEECVHLYLHSREKLNQDMMIMRTSFSFRNDDNTKHSHEDDCHDHHADHSHVIVHTNQDGKVRMLRGLLVVLALSVHELFEGLAVGLETSPATVWYLFGAISAHKLVLAFCVGVELTMSNLKTVFVIIYMFTFAIVSPMGIGIGIVVSELEDSSELVPTCLQGIASGTLLYVVFFEILDSERKSGLKQFFAVLTGFLIMFAIGLIE